MTGIPRAADFTWEAVFDQFDWDAPRELNLTHEVVTRNVGKGTALTWYGDGGDAVELTYADLEAQSSQVANALSDLGVSRGDPVATLVPRLPELYPIFLGIWRAGAVYVPLFTAFGPDAIAARAGDADVNVIFTTPEYRDRVAAVEDEVGFEHVVVVDREGVGVAEEDHAHTDLLAGQPTSHETVRTSADDVSTLEYTSGTTGPPKGCLLTHRVLAALYPYLWYGMGLTGDEVFWGAADPGWMYGLLTAGIAPVSMGVENVLYAGEFDPAAWYDVMERAGVTTLASSPTAYRGLMAEDTLHEDYDLALERGNSAGEPLNPEVVRWFDDELSVPVYDQYGVTEVGMVVGNQHVAPDRFVQGSMGTSIPGFEVQVLADGERAAEGETGELAVKRGGGTYFDGYLNRPQATANSWTAIDGAEWFLTGDAATFEDGVYWFVGRADDVIISSGYRIGPFEVESTLIEHEAVAEAAVVGVPDDQRGEVVAAFVVLRNEFEATQQLREDIVGFVKGKLAHHAYPRRLHIVDDLPKTSSGKIRRVELRDRVRSV
ncbi:MULTISPECIES: acyl-CoA synthetase [unclassified Haladaptatus]|uniref:acyl-CoA synthetase n=1 Tax=unclassified Haladaptatus TaxID=2622732 RepID=UPI0023E80E36|nr:MULTISPECIES: AMP-binding protein [unclassified Haladaptatus]